MKHLPMIGRISRLKSTLGVAGDAGFWTDATPTPKSPRANTAARKWLRINMRIV